MFDHFLQMFVIAGELVDLLPESAKEQFQESTRGLVNYASLNVQIRPFPNTAHSVFSKSAEVLSIAFLDLGDCSPFSLRSVNLVLSPSLLTVIGA